MKNNEPIYVIGHRNPDTDAICSAAAYAALKQRQGFNAQARRLGTLNEETKFVTKYFDVEAPLLMQDARAQLKDLMLDRPVIIHEDTLCHDAWNRMSETATRSLFVVDGQNHLSGIISTSNLAKVRWFNQEELVDLMKNTTVKALAKTVNGDILVDCIKFDPSGEVRVMTMIADPASHMDVEGSICICSDNEQMLYRLIDQDAAAIIVSMGVYVPQDVVEQARKHNVAIIKTPLDSMAIARIIYEAVEVRYLMTLNPVYMFIEDYVQDVMSKVTQSRFRAYPVVNENHEVVGSLSRFHLFGYNKKKFILTDHSSTFQTIKNIEEGEILEIIDHHNIGNIETTKPILYRNQKVGCTCTIIGLMYQEANLKPEPKIAGMMMSAILSDTMNFRSKTTTDIDRAMVKWLAPIAGVEDIEEYANTMLYASISIRTAKPLDILQRDLKLYQFGRFKIGVGQTNYSEIEDIQARVNDYKEVLDDQIEREGLNLLVMMFTHVSGDGTMFVYTGDLSYIMPDIIQTVFDSHSGYDRTIMSRKQQLIPEISSKLEHI